MNRSVLLTLGFVALLAVAGCTGGSGPAAQNNTTTNATPSASYAPGVNASGVTDAPAVSTSYANALENASYTVSKQYTAVYANGSVYAQTTVHGDVDSMTHYALTDAQTGRTLANTSTTYYTGASNGTVFTRTNTSENATYGVDSASPAKRFAKLNVVDNDFVYLTVASANETSASLENGTTNVTAAGFTVTPKHGLDNVTDTHATAVVESDGTLDSLTVTYTATADGEPVHVTRTWTYNTGDASVTAPSWLAQANA